MFPAQTHEIIASPNYDGVLLHAISEERGGPKALLALLKLLETIVHSWITKHKTVKTEGLAAIFKSLYTHPDINVAKLAPEIYKAYFG